MKLLILMVLIFILMGCGNNNGAPTKNSTPSAPCSTILGSMNDGPSIIPSLSGITKLGSFGPQSMANCIAESETVVFNDQVILVGNSEGFVTIYDWNTHAVISQTRDKSAAFNSALVYNNTLYVFSTESPLIKMTSTTDLQNWTPWAYVFNLANYAPNAVQVYNTSVIYTERDGFVMAFEVSGEPGQSGYSWHIVTSTDLQTWTIRGTLFSQEYSACPVVRYVNGYYQFIYLVSYGNSGLVSVVARTQDFITYEKAPNVFLAPASGEGINNSDVSLNEFNGQVYINYNAGNQGGWSPQMTATYNGTMEQMFDQIWNNQ